MGWALAFCFHVALISRLHLSQVPQRPMLQDLLLRVQHLQTSAKLLEAIVGNGAFSNVFVSETSALADEGLSHVEVYDSKFDPSEAREF